MKEEGFTDFDIDPTKIFFEEGEGLENSEQGFLDFGLAEEFGGEGISFKDLFVVDGQGNQAKVSD